MAVDELILQIDVVSMSNQEINPQIKAFFILQVFGTLGGTGESAQCPAEEASKSGAVLRMVATIQAPHIAVS